MRRAFLFLMVAFLAIAVSGCVTVRKVTRERVDQDVSGNQGYLEGTPKAVSGDRAKEREYIDVRVEIPTWKEVRGKPTKKTEASRTGDYSSGNKGYISGSSDYEEELPTSYKESRQEPVSNYEYEDIVVVEDYDDEDIYYEEESLEPIYKEYTVKEGDTLSHISKRFYNKASKWTVIYEANAQKIKDPSRIKPGTVLIIPDLEEAESKYVK